MKHIGTKRMETERLILRPFIDEDASAMYKNWASDPEVTRFLTWPTHSDVEISKMIVSHWVSLYGETNHYQWAIVLKEINEPIGSIAAVSVNDALDKVEIGYCIGQTWWHRGITTEALRAVMDFFFSEVGVNRVEARHDPRNPHSGAVMAKCGMRFEGIQRQADINNMGRCDVAWYGRLASDEGANL